MKEPWPEYIDKLENENLEDKLSRIQLLVTTIRNIRAEMNVPPGKRADVMIRVEDNELGRVFDEYMDYYKGLARIDTITIGPDVKKPAMSASAVLPGAEVFIPLEGLIDVDSERKRLSKELGNLKNQLEKLSRKLANGDFLSNAPKDVIERDRAKKADFENRVEKLNQNLEQLMNW